MVFMKLFKTFLLGKTLSYSTKQQTPNSKP